MNDLIQNALILLALVRENPAALALVIGFVTPLVISVVQQPRLVKWQRTAVAVAASVVLGGLTAYAAGMFDDAKSVVTVIVVLYTASETFYQKLWKQTGLAGAIEAKTSPSGNARSEVMSNEGE